MSVRLQNEAEITALLIAPNRDLAQQFLSTLGQTRAFQILADLKSYPPQQTLEIRARQLKPNVVLLDLASDLAAATELVRFHFHADAAGASDRSAYAERSHRGLAIAARGRDRISVRSLRSGHPAGRDLEVAAPVQTGSGRRSRSRACHRVRQLEAWFGSFHYRHSGRLFASSGWSPGSASCWPISTLPAAPSGSISS